MLEKNLLAWLTLKTVRGCLKNVLSPSSNGLEGFKFKEKSLMSVDFVQSDGIQTNCKETQIKHVENKD
jgi:hypothetical protein